MPSWPSHDGGSLAWKGSESRGASAGAAHMRFSIPGQPSVVKCFKNQE